jgi:hypothetical protein
MTDIYLYVRVQEVATSGPHRQLWTKAAWGTMAPLSRPVPAVPSARHQNEQARIIWKKMVAHILNCIGKTCSREGRQASWMAGY